MSYSCGLHIGSLAMFLSLDVKTSKGLLKLTGLCVYVQKLKERKYKMDGTCGRTGSLEWAGTNLSNTFNRMKWKHIPWIILNIRELYGCLLWYDSGSEI